MQYLEDRIPEFLRTRVSVKSEGGYAGQMPYLFIGVALEGAWSVEDVDEDGHDPLEEDHVGGQIGEDIEVVAQLGCCLHFDAGVCRMVSECPLAQVWSDLKGANAPRSN